MIYNLDDRVLLTLLPLQSVCRLVCSGGEHRSPGLQVRSWWFDNDLVRLYENLDVSSLEQVRLANPDSGQAALAHCPKGSWRRQAKSLSNLYGG